MTMFGILIGSLALAGLLDRRRSRGPAASPRHRSDAGSPLLPRRRGR